MRKLIIILALAIGLSTYAGAKIEWDRLTHDFGAFNETNGPATASFIYYNRGDEPLIITGARANCGCTTPKYTKEALLPGDSGIMTVSYDPAGRPGRFEKKVFIDSNSDPKRSTLTIRGTVVGSGSTIAQRYPVEAGSLRLAHQASLMGTITKGRTKSVFETGYNVTTKTLQPVIKKSPSWIDVKVLPDVVGPGEQVSFSLYVHGDKIPQWDTVTDYVVIQPDKDDPMTIKFPVVVTLNEDFGKLTDQEKAKAPVVRVSDKRLDTVTATKSGAEASFVVFNDGQSEMKIRRLYTQMGDVKTDISANETVKAGKSRKINVKIPVEMLKGAKAKAIVLTLVTNDPVNPKLNITIPVDNPNGY